MKPMTLKHDHFMMQSSLSRSPSLIQSVGLFFLFFLQYSFVCLQTTDDVQTEGFGEQTEK